MKKLMTIGLAAVLMFAVASQVQAATALETTGELRVRAFYLDSYTGGVAHDDATNEFWDQRLRLGMKWQISDSVKVEARADVLEGFWGDNSTKTAFAVSGDAASGYSVATTSTGVAAKDQISFDRVFMQFTWPNTPITLTIGRQEASWGPGIVTKADNRDRFKIVGAFDFGTLVALYQKRTEVFTTHITEDDNRQYAVAYLGKAAGWNFGVLIIDTMFDATPGSDTQHFIFDVMATGKAGPADIAFEAGYLTGTTENDATADVDLSGLIAYAGVFVPAGPVKIGVEGAYASGNDPNTAKNEGGIKFDYHGPFHSVVLFNNMDLDGYAGETSVSGNSSVGNAVAGKLSLVAVPAPGLTLMGAVVYAQRLEATATGGADPLGVEFDLVASYAITPNVNWVIGAGYLLPGDYYAGDPSNALAATSQFVVKF